MGIAHDGETTKGDEKFNKATTQCPISNKVVEYVHIHVQLIIMELKCYVGFQGTMSFKRFEKLS